jgi:hypothetical protein
MAARPAPQAAADQDTAEDTAPVAQSSNWDTIYLVFSLLMLIAATVIVLYTAGTKYNAGIFAKGA